MVLCHRLGGCNQARRHDGRFSHSGGALWLGLRFDKRGSHVDADRARALAHRVSRVGGWDEIGSRARGGWSNSRLYPDFRRLRGNLVVGQRPNCCLEFGCLLRGRNAPGCGQRGAFRRPDGRLDLCFDRFRGDLVSYRRSHQLLDFRRVFGGRMQTGRGSQRRRDLHLADHPSASVEHYRHCRRLRYFVGHPVR